MRNRTSRWQVRIALVILNFSTMTFLSATSASAEELFIPCGGTATYQLTLPTGAVQNGQKCQGSLKLDSRARVIGKNAFSFSKITDAELPDGVTSIEAGAFSYTNLNFITLGKSIESLGFEAFRGSKFLSIELPPSLKYIGESAFADTYFRRITIPNSVVSIGTTAFAREDSGAPLDEVALPDSVKTLGSAAFVRAQIQKISIGAGLETIPASAFEGNRIRELIIPKNVKYIQAFAFRRNPIEKIQFSEGLLLVDSEAFSFTNVETLTLPQTLVSIGTKAFANNSKLKELDISDSYEGSIAPDNTPTVGDVFAEDYALQRIFYCGKASGFYVKPTCDGVRKSAASKRAAEESQRVDDEEKQRQAAQSAFELEQRNGIADAIKRAAISDVPITIKVTGENPICPEGFQLMINSKPAKGPRGITILCTSQVKPEAERLEAMRKQKLEESSTSKPEPTATEKALPQPQVKAEPSPSPKVVPVAKPKTKMSITCVRGKLKKVVTGVAPKCPKGYSIMKRESF